MSQKPKNAASDTHHVTRDGVVDGDLFVGRRREIRGEKFSNHEGLNV